MRSAPFRPAIAALLVFGGCYSASRQEPAPRLPASEAIELPAATPVAPPPSDAPRASADPALQGRKLLSFGDDSLDGSLVRPDAAATRSPREAPPAVALAAPAQEPVGGLAGGRAGIGTGAGHGKGGAVAGRSLPARGALVSEPDLDAAARDGGGEGYTDHGVNPFTETARDPFSTFAVDVDTASYSIARRKLLSGVAPPAASVRVEEFVNYFRYDYPAPQAGPFAVHLDAAPSPFTPGRHLLRVGVQGKRISNGQRAPAHLTFLVDVSGSMNRPDRLPLAKQALGILVQNLNPADTVALVTYAGSVRVVLPPTSAASRATILGAIEELRSGGGTAMGSGIELAYQQAARGLDGRSSSRVIVLSDGDANIGAVSHERILATIRGHVSEGVTLTTVGFGMGNYKNTMMEQLADKGDGNAFYVDSLAQARRIFQQELAGTLEVIAKDVKLQVELDPERVLRYRLIGYENRDVADRDFRNDRVDAGEIGAGHSVTALYEVELVPGAVGQLARVHVRAKAPRGERAEESSFAFGAERLYRSFESAPPDFRFATAVMATAEKLRGSAHSAGWDFDAIRRIAAAATPPGNAERAEFLALLGRAAPVVAQLAAR